MTTRFQRCVSAACLFALAGAASAQVKAPVGPENSRPVGEKGPAAPVLEKFGEKGPGAGPRFDLSFSGGTLDEYVALLRSVAGATANLVVTSDVEDLPIGKVSLRQVTVPDAVQVIGTASRQSGDKVTAAMLERQGEIWVVRATTSMRAGAQRAGAPGRVEVFNITGAAGPSTPAETTLSAVEAAVRLIDRPGSQTQISYHKESGLLFVMGTEEAQESVRNVVRGIGANRDVAQQRASAEVVASLLGLLGAGDIKSAHDRVRELLATAKKLDEQKVDAAVSMARVEADARMMQLQAKQLQDRIIQLTDQSQKAEQVYRAKLDELETTRMNERREMLDQIAELRKALESAQRSK